jgi:hypothetical protein
MTIWQSLLLAFGGQVTLLVALAFLLKAIITHRLSQEAEAFKVNLQAQVNIEIERLRSSLQIVATEHQVRFSKLHEKRGEGIAELYRLIVETPVAAVKFILFDNRDEALVQQAKERVRDLFTFLNLNRIYLPNTVCQILDNYERRLRHSVASIMIYWTRIEYPNAQMREEQNRVMREACAELERDLPAIRQELESEFRQLLGVEAGASGKA